MAVIPIFTAKVDYYPCTSDNKETHFKDWQCSHCLGKDPTTNGGTVAHERIQVGDKVIQGKTHPVFCDGTAHPDHRDCIVTNYKYRTGCSHCGIELDLNSILTRTEKLAVAIAYLPAYLKRCVKSSRLMNSSAIISLSFGIYWKIPVLLAVGSVCLSRGLQPLESRQSLRAARVRQVQIQSREALQSYMNRNRSAEESLTFASQIRRDLESLSMNIRAAEADIDGSDEMLPMIDQLRQDNLPDQELSQQIAQKAIDSLQQARTLASRLTWVSRKETLYSWVYKGARKCAQLAAIGFAMYAPYARSSRS